MIKTNLGLSLSVWWCPNKIILEEDLSCSKTKNSWVNSQFQKWLFYSLPRFQISLLWYIHQFNLCKNNEENIASNNETLNIKYRKQSQGRGWRLLQNDGPWLRPEAHVCRVHGRGVPHWEALQEHGQEQWWICHQKGYWSQIQLFCKKLFYILEKEGFTFTKDIINYRSNCWIRFPVKWISNRTTI